MPSIPSQIEEFIATLDRKLHEPGFVGNALGNVERKTGVKRLHAFGGLTSLFAIYLLFGRWAQLACNLTGFLYPAWASIKAVESHSKEDDTQWLTYWVVFSLLSVMEFFSPTILHYFPFYWLLKTVTVLWLYMPATLGAQLIYSRIVRPFVVKSKSSGVNKAAREFSNEAKEN